MRLSVARDEAFCFYYPENLTFLEDHGFAIEYFSPIRDDKLPDGTDAILIGGGYPELYLPQLSANTSMLASIREAIENGAPSLAECGGFMYLHKVIEDRGGKPFEMAGVIDGRCTFTGHLVNFGYCEIEELGIRGHEFHYYESDANGSDLTIRKPSTGKEYKSMHAKDGHLWGWPHLYYPSGERIEQFINILRK